MLFTSINQIGSKIDLDAELLGIKVAVLLGGKIHMASTSYPMVGLEKRLQNSEIKSKIQIIKKAILRSDHSDAHKSMYFETLKIYQKLSNVKIKTPQDFKNLKTITDFIEQAYKAETMMMIHIARASGFDEMLQYLQPEELRFIDTEVLSISFEDDLDKKSRYFKLNPQPGLNQTSPEHIYLINQSFKTYTEADADSSHLSETEKQVILFPPFEIPNPRRLTMPELIYTAQDSLVKGVELNQNLEKFALSCYQYGFKPDEYVLYHQWYEQMVAPSIAIMQQNIAQSAHMKAHMESLTVDVQPTCYFGLTSAANIWEYFYAMNVLHHEELEEWFKSPASKVKANDACLFLWVTPSDNDTVIGETYDEQPNEDSGRKSLDL